MLRDGERARMPEGPKCGSFLKRLVEGRNNMHLPPKSERKGYLDSPRPCLLSSHVYSFVEAKGPKSGHDRPLMRSGQVWLQKIKELSVGFGSPCPLPASQWLAGKALGGKAFPRGACGQVSPPFLIEFVS
jgi:hypothetical protein